jgi:hypothetical protein
VRHERAFLELELHEMPYWVQWIKNDLVHAGMDLPSPETCLDFIRAALDVARRVRRVSGHLPASLRSVLIQSTILHQCWIRQTAVHRKNRSRIQLSTINCLDAMEFVSRIGSKEYVMTTSDGHDYDVQFPTAQRIVALATAVICSELARAMGIPVPLVGLIQVSDRLAARAGVQSVIGRITASAFDSDGVLPCLGMRSMEMLDLDHRGRPVAIPLHPRTFGLLAGATVFNILILNTIQQRQVFRVLNGKAEPVLTDFCHCAMDADWPRFLKAGLREPIACAPLTHKISSYEQLEPWVRRAEQVDLDRICEIAIKLPAEWYGHKPALVPAVMEKVHQRIGDLRETIFHLIHAGYFNSIPTQRETTLDFETSSQMKIPKAVQLGVVEK